METDTIPNVWNKKTSDLTVKEVVLINVAVPIIAIGGLVVVGVVITAKDKIVAKFRNRKGPVVIQADDIKEVN